MRATLESEIAARYANTQDVVKTWVTFVEMGYFQPSATLTIDNITVHGILTK